MPPARSPARALTVVGDSDQSIYAFRGADIRNIVEFERDFPGAKVVLLEQNYRSTQNILCAANAVISNNFDRKDKKLWTAVGDGEKIVGYTGYTGARRGAVRRRRDRGAARRRRRLPRHRRVLPHQRADPCAGGDLRALGPAVPGRRRHQVLRARRDQGRDGLPHRRREPARRARPPPHPEHPQARHRPGHRDGARELRRARTASRFRQAMRDADGLGLGPKVTGAILQLANLLDEAARDARARCRGDRRGHERGRREGLRRARASCSTAAGLLETLRNSRDPQDETRAENVEELLAQTKDFDRENPDAGARRLPHPGVARGRRRRARRRHRHRLADDPAHREGPRVRRGVPHRHRGGAAAAPDVGRRARRPGRGAPPVLRGHHPRPQAALPLARDDAAPSSARSTVAMPSRYLQEIPERAHRLAAVARHGQLARRHPAARAQRPARTGQGGSAAAAWGTRDRDLDRFSCPPSAAAQDRVGQPGHRHGARQRRPHARGGRPHPAHRLRRGPGQPGHRRGHQAHRPRAVRHRRAKKLLIKIAPIEKL